MIYKINKIFLINMNNINYNLTLKNKASLVKKKYKIFNYVIILI
jgi:hypothetical protein